MKSILVSVMVNIGDVVMITSVFDLIRQRFPTLRIVALARPEAVCLLENNPVVDEVIVYPYRSGSLFRGLGTIRHKVSASGCDVFLSLDRRFRSALVAWLAGINVRLGPDLLFEGRPPKAWTRFFFTRTVRLTQKECRGDQIEMFQWVARRALSIEGRGRVTLPSLSSERKHWAEALFEGARGPIVGFCVKTNEPSKTWPAAGFAALLRRLKAEFDICPYIIGGPDDRDYITGLLGDEADLALNLAGRTSLLDLTALAAVSDLYIGPDNGAAHLVANSGLPKMICILISTTPEKIATSMPKARFLSFPALDEKAPDRLNAEIDEVFRMAVELLVDRRSEKRCDLISDR